jgi:3-deoxy-D-manno-octulosonic-acid transferase
VILGDTMGELRKFYALATVVLVGRTLLDLGPRQRGSDMIEPAALAKPTLVGPWTQNFAEVINAFRAAHAIYEIDDPAQLAGQVRATLADPAAARATAHRGQDVVRQRKGATARHVEMILARPELTGRHSPPSPARH